LETPRFIAWVRATASEFELPQGIFESQVVMSSRFTENGATRAGLERVVRGDGEMMFATGLRGEPTMRTALSGELLAQHPAQGFLQVGCSQITRQLHARASNSSNPR
jgi:hypothetical protein